MARTSSYLPLFVRRRTRTSLFCGAVLFLIAFTFLHDSSPYRSSSSDAGKPFLEVINFPWPQSTRRPTRPPGRITGSEDFQIDNDNVDELPEIPPTLQTDDDDEGYDDEFNDDEFDYREGYDSSLPPHTYRPDGLLVTNPAGAHPIYELVARAEKQWADKHKRASRTLDEAVEEYERRYKRPPPVGFDHW